MEFMYEDIKRGLHAELLRNRSFEEAPNAIGLSRYWERYPDDRIDDYGIAFAWASDVAYPNTTQTEGLINGHSLRVEVKPGNIARHGVHQSGIPVRSGLEYRGYLWIKADAFTRRRRRGTRSRRTGGRVYDERAHHGHRGRLEEVSVHAEAVDERSARALRDSSSGHGHALDRSGVAHSW